MHAYTITAKPGRVRLAVRAVCRWVPRLLIGTGLALLGVAVFVLRSAHALLGVTAYVAARIEFAAAERASRRPLGQTLGAGVAAAFVAEFTRTPTAS